MTLSRTLFRLLPGLLFVSFLVSAVQLGRIFAGQLTQIKAEGQIYRRSPGCLPNATDVDPSLPPCQYVPVTVTGKERRRSHSNDLNRDYNTNSLDVQGGAGGPRRFIVTGDDLWDSVKVGDPVTEEVWKGRVIHVSANGSSASVTEAGYTLSQVSGGTWAWLFVCIAASFGLGVERFVRRVRDVTTWGGVGW